MSNSTIKHKASNKPIIWSLFAAGGTVTALLLPILIVIIALAVPLDLLSADLFNYERIHDMLGIWFVRLVVFGFLFLSIWHAAHRMRITLHDFGLRSDGFAMFLFYGLAAVSTVFMAYILWW